MSGVHENLKYGDLIYIEFYHNSREHDNKFMPKDKEMQERYSITAEGFSLKTHSDIYLRKVDGKQNLNNYENKLFIIFPQMSEKFLHYKCDLEEKLNNIISKLDTENQLEINKEDISKMIFNYNETKKEVHCQGSTIINQIGMNIKYSDQFVLIHFKSQMYVSVLEEDGQNKKGITKLSLSESYSENSIFCFWPVKKSESENDETFSNQDIYIRKYEKNVWANNPFLRVSESNDKKNPIKNLLNTGVKKILTTGDTLNSAQKFEIRICSNYIDPSSINLSFSNKIWLTSPSQDKFLLVNNNEKKIKKLLNMKLTLNEIDNQKDEDDNDYLIKFNDIEKEKSINNIYGLFSLEQIEETENTNNTKNYEDNNKSRMSAYIQYNKVVRLKHTATKKYLGFVPLRKDELVMDKNYYNFDASTHELGTLFLTEDPKDDCEWILMESYIILNRENYEKSKLDGMKFNSNRIERKKENLVKKKDIVRIFHNKSNKFLSFSNIKVETEKLSKIILPSKQKIHVSLNKLPLDKDLFKILPSNESTLWQINLILYFSNKFDELIKSCNNTKEGLTTKINNYKTTKFSKSPKNLTVKFNENIDIISSDTEDLQKIEILNQDKIELESIESSNKKKWQNLSKCFGDLADFCLNKYTKRYDPTVPTGKPVYYRQEFLHEQKFIEKTLQFLKMSNSNLKEIKFENQIFKSENNSNVVIECIEKSFKFLSAVCKNNPINKQFVFNKKDIFFKNDFLKNFKEATECLIEIIKDDEIFMMKIIQENIGNQFKNHQNIEDSNDKNNLIDTIIKYLNNKEHYDIYTLSLLPKLMKSKNKGITSNQAHIFTLLIDQRKDKFLLKIEPMYDSPGFDIIYKNESMMFEKKSLIELCKIRGSISNYDRDIVYYLSEQLKIYADMCFGRNYICIEKMKDHFPLDHLLYHICRIDLYEEILLGLINILNYVYIDVQPHFQYFYTNMVKIIDNDPINNNLVVMKPKSDKQIVTHISLDKLNIILCNSLYLLYYLKFGKSLVNTSNINLIYNLISFRLYDNVEFINSKNNNTEIYDFGINFLKMEIKKIISSNDPNKDLEETPKGFYEIIGYKFIEFSHEKEIGKDYLFFVMEYINEYLLKKFILENLGSDFENRNIIVENFNSIGKQDILTQNNINFLMKSNSEIKKLITHSQTNTIIDIAPIIKPIYRTIELIFIIKQDEHDSLIIENLIKENMSIILTHNQKFRNGKIYETCYNSLLENHNFQNIFMDNSSSLHKLSPKTEKFNFLNQTAFHNLNELIIRILEINSHEYLIKVMVKLFSRVNSQRSETIKNLKSIKLLFNTNDINSIHEIQKHINILRLNTETTELWLKEEISESDKDYKNVLESLDYLSRKFMVKSSVKCFENQEKINFLQTFFFSIQFDLILFSLLREIIQLYPDQNNNEPNLSKKKSQIYLDQNNNEPNIYKKKSYHNQYSKNEISFEKSKVFLDMLTILIKKILKLIKYSIHESEVFKQKIFHSFLDFMSNEFLFDLGYLSLLRKLISLNKKYKLENSDLILEIIQKEYKNVNFLEIKTNFKSENLRNASKDNYINFKDINKLTRMLKLMNIFIKNNKDEKILGILIRQYEDIFKCLNNINFFGFKENNKYEIKYSAEKINVLTILIKIGCKFIKINNKSKGLIKSLLSIETLEEKIIKKEIFIDLDKLDMDVQISKMKPIDGENQISPLHAKSLISSMKIKYYSCKLYYLLSNLNYKNFKNNDFIKQIMDVFSADLKNFNKNRKYIYEKIEEDKPLMKIYVNYAYKYFILGALRMINIIKGINFEASENDKIIENISLNEFKMILIDNELFKTNYSYLSKKVIRYLQDSRIDFENFKLPVFQKESPDEIPYKVEKVFDEFNLIYKKNSDRFSLESKKIFNDFIKNSSIAFTEDILTNIEKIDYTRNYIREESKIIAKIIKNRINFHNILDFYFNNSNSIEAYSDYNFHLFNIFLKFIQEKYMNKKYYNQLKFIIQLFADFIVAKTKILKIPKNADINNFFYKNVLELNNVCLLYCQKLLLTNGTIDIFVKIITNNNNDLNKVIFPAILKVFNKILKNGNTLSQKKFYELFNYNQTDNFFKYLKTLFLNDPFLKCDNKLKDDDSTELIIRLLKFFELLTKNHNLNLQNYLREQTNFIKIIVNHMEELLNKLTNFLRDENVLGKEVTKKYYSRIIACLDTLCEFLQGPCQKNQESIINSKIIELFDRILRETDFPIISQDEMEEEIDLEENNHHSESLNNNENNISNNNRKIFRELSNYEKSLLIYKSGLVLLAILEGKKTVDEVIKKILRDFNYKIFYDKMKEIFFLIKSKELKFYLFKTNEIKKILNYHDHLVCESGFNLYFFLSHLYTICDLNSDFSRYYAEMSREIYIKSENYSIENKRIMMSMKFYKENSLNVEIVRNGNIHKVFFPKLNYFKQFTNEIMQSFRENANYSSIQTKLTSILNESENLRQTIKLIDKVENKFKKLYILKYLLLYPKIFQIGSIVLSIIVNIFIILSYSNVDIETKKNVIDRLKYKRLFWFFSEKVTNRIFDIIGGFMILFSGLVFIDFIFRKAPLLYRSIIGKYYKNLYETKTKSISPIEINRIYQILKQEYLIEILKKIGISLQLLLNLEIIYYLGYILLAICSLTIHPFFFCYHLIEFIRSQEVLKDVLKAIYNPITQIFFIFFFFLILQYFYSLLIYYLFYDQMPNGSCDSVLICMTNIYTNTFTSNGNLGGFMDTSYPNKSGSLSRYFLDFSYNIIMVWLVFQMISGLIVDTFSSLRKKQEEYDRDYRNICFICGLDREEIEKLYLGKEGFNNHLEDHKVSSYFSFMFYLKEMATGDSNGLETYVMKLMEKESISWFPQLKFYSNLLKVFENGTYGLFTTINQLVLNN